MKLSAAQMNALRKISEGTAGPGSGIQRKTREILFDAALITVIGGVERVTGRHGNTRNIRHAYYFDWDAEVTDAGRAALADRGGTK